MSEGTCSETTCNESERSVSPPRSETTCDGSVRPLSPSTSETTDSESEQPQSPSPAEATCDSSEQTTTTTPSCGEKAAVPSHGESEVEGYETVEAPLSNTPYELTDEAIEEMLVALRRLPDVPESHIPQRPLQNDVMDQDLLEVLGMDIPDFLV